MSDYNPLFQTERFDVFHHHIVRNPELGLGRDVYTAWHRHEDWPRPFCFVVLFANYVEWIETSSSFRRQGVGREVLEGLEKHVGLLQADPGSDDGEHFLEALGRWEPV